MDPKEIIIKNKTQLIRWLRMDSFILQHVQSKNLLTMNEYVTVSSVVDPNDKIITLLDQIIGKGSGICADFLDLLKKDEVNEASPELRQWIATVNRPTSEGSFNSFSESKLQASAVHGQSQGISMNVQATGGSTVFAPFIVGCTSKDININDPVRSEETKRKS